ncbi:Pentatricopeptide repeat-containing protein At4g18520, chloroplastic [Linum perenne]
MVPLTTLLSFSPLSQTSVLVALDPFHSYFPTKLTSRTRKNRSATSVNLLRFSNKHDLGSDDPRTILEFPSSEEADAPGRLPSQPYSWSVNSVLLGLWLRSCHTVKDVKRFHAVSYRCLRSPVVYVNNNLISAYSKLGVLDQARKTFDEMPHRNVVSWTAMIDGCFEAGLDDEALSLLIKCIEIGIRPNHKTFVCVLNLCSRRLDFDLGRQVHASIVKENWRNVIVDTAIVHFYAKSGDLAAAFCAFDGMVERDVVCWTTMITACSQQGLEIEAFGLLSRMLRSGLSPNEFTICSVLKACGVEKELKFGRQLHGAIVKKMWQHDVFIGSSLVDMYAKCEEILDASKVFRIMRKKNTVTWTSLIAGYAREGLGEDAISLFRQMQRRKVSRSDLTTVSILKACGSIGALMTGKEVHAQIIKDSVQSNEYIGTSLVWFYCKCGEWQTAAKVFQQMSIQSVVSWTAKISGFANLGHDSEALGFLIEMMEEGVEPNSYTYSSALKACAGLNAVVQGKSIHSFANKTQNMCNVHVATALVHMYVRCGYLPDAIKVFDEMPKRNLLLWRSMITAYTKNGLFDQALRLMHRMEAEGLPVDGYVSANVFGAFGENEDHAGEDVVGQAVDLNTT